jgi:hypothetical protein
MRPYVVCTNEYLLKIAFKFGFDADSVWNDPSNDDLRKLRPDPNILLAGDVLYIPDDKPPVVHSLVTGTTNEFVSPDPPTVVVTQTFGQVDPKAYSSKAFTVTELENLTGLTTDGNGTATFPVPVTLDSVSVVFTDSGEVWRLILGGMDPIDTLVGVFKRLQNLHYIAGSVAYLFGDRSNDIEIVRSGLRRLKGAYGQVDAPGADAPNADPSSPNSSPDSPPISNSAPVADTAGLDDDGNLNDDTRQLLLQAYGC